MDRTLRRKAAIIGYGELKPGKRSDKSPMELYAEVSKLAIEDAGIKKSDIDGLLCVQVGNNFVFEELVDYLRIQPTFCAGMNVGGATHSAMAIHAASAIASGVADIVLCASAGRFRKVLEVGEGIMRLISHPDFELIYGTFIPALYALSAKRHMHDYGTTSEQLARVAVSARKWANMNPDALMYDKGPLTIEDVLNSPMIADPFHYYDCSIPCEGGGAFVIASAEIAKRVCKTPMYLLGAGECHTQGFATWAPDFSTHGTKVSGKRAFDMAGLSPKDVDVLEIYDSFTSNPIMYLEDLGFCEKGEGGKVFEAGRCDPGGDLPLNTFGGLLSFGHTGMSSGIIQSIEAARQLMGRAGNRQVKDAEVALAHTYGGMTCDHATLIWGR